MSTSPVTPASPPRLRIAVIGGGITGMAAAHRLIELAADTSFPLDLRIFESSSRMGGVFGSEQIGDYLIERGADSFITNKPWGIDLCRRLGLEDQLISTNPRFRRSLILSRGRPVATPEGFNLLAPAKLWPMMTTPLLSWSGKLRLAAEPFIARRREKTDESLAAFVRRRLGPEMLDRIVQPMVGGIYTSDPEHLSLQATLPRFIEMERKYGSLLRGMKKQKQLEGSAGRSESQSASGARYGLFVSFRNGMQQLLDTLEQRIVAQTQRRSGPQVTRIQQLEQMTGWRIETVDGRTEEFDGIILTVPPRKAADLLGNVNPEAAAVLGKIESASSAIVVTGHSLSDVQHPLDAFGLVIPHTEKRRILATSFLSRKFDGRAPEGKVVLRTFVGGAMQPEVLDQSDDSLIETVLQELRSILGVRKTPDFAVVARYPEGMPQYTVGHLERIAELQCCEQAFPTLQLAGNYRSGVGVPDCIQSGEQAAESLFKTLQAPRSSG
ncbi:protoporphyrinogen oxidase [Planctomicrobium sp. SH661]|uniref:protoporphyrinogen oxidase n=1 Tax=Planctomicrobium sp. SH661 TaxID=3448124 RepID=UPI003F5C47A3